MALAPRNTWTPCAFIPKLTERMREQIPKHGLKLTCKAQACLNSCQSFVPCFCEFLAANDRETERANQTQSESGSEPMKKKTRTKKSIANGSDPPIGKRFVRKRRRSTQMAGILQVLMVAEWGDMGNRCDRQMDRCPSAPSTQK